MSWKSLFLTLLVGSFVGCGSKSSVNQVAPPPQRPLRSMESAIRRGLWQQAWELSDAVLATHPDDADAIATVARVAHENKKLDVAAELLVRACRAESFQNASRVQQAMIAMIGIGRLHEGMAMLEEVVEKQPMQHETRRWLFDFYIGTENRIAGVPHGRFLVRHRQFDLDLLLAISNSEQRSLDEKPLEEMTSRNPEDKRPLLGMAKREFDGGEYEKSIDTLRSIIEAHEDYFPAQALLGRVLAASGQYDKLDLWSSKQREGIEAYTDYWLALGDWARSKQQVAAAARAYWEATQLDADLMESWAKLSATLQQLQASGTAFADDQMAASIQARASQLSKFNQLKSRFERTGGISRATAVEMVEALRDLGRLWEAEAWASVSLTLPEDDSVSANQVRDSIVAMLHKETPWQLMEGHPELQLDLTSLPLPAIGTIAISGRVNSMRIQAAQQADAGKIRLLDEAQERGLMFHGRTGNDLDQAGIMLFQTLGCGGGTIDFDLDGWSDLYLIAAGGTPPERDSDPNLLVRNVSGEFSDVTATSGTGDTGFGQGVAVGDVNEDGFPDLLVLNYGPNTLLVNNGDGTFTDVSEKLESNGIDWSASAAIADLDSDGQNDLVIVNYCAGLEPTTRKCPLKNTDLVPSCTPMVFPGRADLFLQGSATGKFVDRTVAWKVQPTVVGRGLGVVAGSFDGNPGVDVFIANDMTNNHYWSRSIGDDSFSLAESAMLRGLGGDDRAMAQGSMGIATGDLDRDGDIDFYVTNFNGEYNTYHDHRDGDMWQDETARLGLSESTMTLVGFGTEAVDLENDGTVELVVTNGHVDIFPRSDQFASDDRRSLSLYAQPMQVFRRNASQSFDSIGGALQGEYLATPHVGRALWTIDANRDGLTDLAVTHQTEPVALLVNHSEGGGKWIDIDLRGRTCSRDAIGATVEVTIGDIRWTAVQTSGDGYLCSNQRRLRFGLGASAGPCNVNVTWPDGTTQIYRDLESHSAWLLVQDDLQAFRQQ